MSEGVEQEESFGQSNYLKLAPIALFFFGLFLLTVGLGFTLFRNQSSDSDIKIISQEENTSQIVVHVDGAVVKPGVYRVSPDSRVGDAVSKAGGFLGEADTTKVNLAAKLSDGQKILIPKIGQAGGTVSGEATGTINVNSASEKELDTLPGVGPVTAQKIIASRPYSSPEELLTKKAVSQSVYEKIKELITVY